MSSSPIRIGETLQQTYRVERLIGKGGMGSVFEASHLRLPRRFAIKVLEPAIAEHPEALARFKREAHVTSGLGHPHILEVIDFNHTGGGIPYIVMELLEGEELSARISRLTHLTVHEATSVFRQAASALNAAHEAGIVHRDLKPQNIFLCRRGSRDDFVKVVDFGISKILHCQSALTKTNSLLGTPYYMAPEQAEERAEQVDLRADIYAMGTILYEMLAGKPPFSGASVAALLYQVVHKDPPPLSSLRPELPPALSDVVARALGKKPEQRFDTMTAFWKAFAAVAQEDDDPGFTEFTEDREPELKPRSGMGGRRVGNYVVSTLLGEGGMGAVYLAEHPEIGRKVAIKVLASHLMQNKNAVERFISEAKAVNRIAHPNIIEIFDFGRLKDGACYYVMEQLEGTELLAVMERAGKMRPVDIWPYLQQICAALQAAHDAGIIHRDLKPENIFVLDREPLTLKVLDFGLAKLLESAHGPQLSRTATGMVMGSPLVIAPEQAAGQPDRVTPRTDLYSLGVMLYWMLAGHPPFEDKSVALLLAKHIQHEPPRLSDVEPSVPAAIAELVARCLQKDPQARPASAAEVAATFASALGLRWPADLAVTGPMPSVAAADPAPAMSQLALQQTTLSASTGETISDLAAAPPRAGLGKWLALAGGVGVAAIVAAVVLLRGDARPVAEPGVPAPPAAAAAAAPPAPARHRVVVEADEATCQLRVDGTAQPDLTSPCKLEVESGQRVELKVVRAGYEPYAEAWTAKGDRHLALRLRAALPPKVVADSPQPAAQKPQRPPAVARPRAAKPAAAQPTAAKPTAEKPAAEKPAAGADPWDSPDLFKKKRAPKRKKRLGDRAPDPGF